MVTGAAARVSLRSRERKLRLFLDLFQPGPETTVVDVGVTDAPFGAGSSDNFFEALYPWPEPDHRRRATPSSIASRPLSRR